MLPTFCMDIDANLYKRCTESHRCKLRRGLHIRLTGQLPATYRMRRCMEQSGVIFFGVLQPNASICSDRHYMLLHCAGQPGCGLAVPERSHNCPHGDFQGLQAGLYTAIA